MLNTWPYEQTEVLIALWSEDLDLPSSVFGIYPWVSSRLKHGDDNRGSRAIRRHFDSRCEVTLSIGHFGKYRGYFMVGECGRFLHELREARTNE